MPHLLETVEFRDPTRARREFASLTNGLSLGIASRIETLIADSPDPERVLRYMVNLRQQCPEEFPRLTAGPASLQHLIAVFSYSRFLSDELLKYPEWLQSMEPLDRAVSAERYIALLNTTEEVGPLALATFRRRQLLRILIRDVLGLCTLSETTEEISNLADAILQVSYDRLRKELIAKHGTPHCEGPDGVPGECGMVVLALGKLGGRELNYSSDIDLMFVYGGAGETDGPQPISNKEFYKKVANEYTHLLSTYTSEGMCYRVDLRLRPDGSLGEACISLDGAKKYYQTRGRDWELQMLIKGRAAAGDRELGRSLLEFVEPQIYSTTLDFSTVESVSVTRERIGEKLHQRRPKAGFDVKLARGGIRDIEFLAQCLQRLHGGRVPWIQQGGTLMALSRLHDRNLLSDAEYGRLASAYRFLRMLEHRLQFEDDRQTHTLPTDLVALDLLARKMPMGELGNTPSGEKLLRELNLYLESVQEIYERVIHAQKPMYYSVVASSPQDFDLQTQVEPSSSNLVRYLDQKAPQLAKLVARTSLRSGTRAFEHFLEKMVANPQWLALLDGSATVARHVLDIFGHSPYLADELIRTPELVEDVAALSHPVRSGSGYRELILLVNDPADLRRFFRREIFRTQIASLCLSVPVFETLAQTSDLADAAILAAYRMAIDQVRQHHPPASPFYPVRNQMMVVSLGRLGMREFDLSSDADLLFVLSDQDHHELEFWTRVANRLTDIISAYTGAGVIFSIDPRLRPNGGAGALVQSESAYKEYFSKHAEAWEGIAYMKSRAVAGDIDRATNFLNALQELDWRRYGQSGRSKKDLRAMRLRLEREQGRDNPLKAGMGGFYDIDFTLLYLRLKSAGIFFKVLNMPERIDIIEKMGHLERADAEFLRDAVTFYRAIDHGIRIYSGHAEGNLPSSELQLQMLTEIVHRWTPEHLNHQPLHTQLRQIRARTRELFERLFA